MTRDSKIYRAFLEARDTGNKTVSDVAFSFGISRSAVYEAVRRVRHGNPHATKYCIDRARLECLWQHKWKPRFDAIPPENGTVAKTERRAIIKGMQQDGFPIKQIAERLGRQRQYIYQQLNK